MYKLLPFFWDATNVLHQVYYDQNSNAWQEHVHTNIVSAPGSPWKIDQYNKLFYTSGYSNNKMKVFWWDNPCTTNPPCTYLNYKPLKNNTVKISETPFDKSHMQFMSDGKQDEFLKEKDILSQVDIFPNPSGNGIFNVVSNTPLKISVSDIQGRVIINRVFNFHEKTIDLSDKPSGVYILSYQGNGKVEKVKLVITK